MQLSPHSTKAALLLASSCFFSACSKPAEGDGRRSGGPGNTAETLNVDQSHRIQHLIQSLPQIDPTLATIKIDVNPGDAQHLVVVTSMIHGQRHLSNDAAQLVTKWNTRSQEALVIVGSALKISEISGDGITPELARRLNDDSRLYRALLENGYSGGTSVVPLDIRHRIELIESMRSSAPLAAVVFGRSPLTVIGLEDPRLIAQAESIIRKQPLDETALADNAERREDKILQNISRRKGLVQVLCMGLSHRFRDNVEEFNRQHPQDKIALVSVELTGLQDDFDRLLASPQ